MAKWKCDICNSEFDNFHAEGFDNKIYCPLCFYKHEFNRLQQEKKELIEWLEDEIKNCNPNPQLYFDAQDEIKRRLYSEILEKLGDK